MEGALILYGITMSIWLIWAIGPISYIKWVSWKNIARRAISDGHTTKCRICNDHIFPGQQVVKVQHEDTHPGEFLVHIARAPTLFTVGGHFSLKTRYASCALLFEGQKNLGVWNGLQFIPDSSSPQVS